MMFRISFIAMVFFLLGVASAVLSIRLLDEVAYAEIREGGIVRRTGFTDKGQRVGTWRYYADNGQLIRLETFVEGRRDGVFCEWTEKGSLEYWGFASNGSIDGFQLRFPADSGEVEVSRFANGDLEWRKMVPKAIFEK